MLDGDEIEPGTPAECVFVIHMGDGCMYTAHCGKCKAQTERHQKNKGQGQIKHCQSKNDPYQILWTIEALGTNIKPKYEES